MKPDPQRIKTEDGVKTENHIGFAEKIVEEMEEVARFSLWDIEKKDIRTAVDSALKCKAEAVAKRALELYGEVHYVAKNSPLHGFIIQAFNDVMVGGGK